MHGYKKFEQLDEKYAKVLASFPRLRRDLLFKVTTLFGLTVYDIAKLQGSEPDIIGTLVDYTDLDEDEFIMTEASLIKRMKHPQNYEWTNEQACMYTTHENMSWLTNRGSVRKRGAA
jgi:hypothetical protein